MNMSDTSLEFAVPLEDIPETAVIQSRLPVYTAQQRKEKIARIKHLLKQENAVLIAHYYTHETLQKIAEETGGYVSDSLEMARFGSRHEATTLVVAGVRFMGETAKILNPEKRVLMPTLQATCSLDLGCPAREFSEFCDRHPEHEVVVYANTSAEVKARADWVVTSSIAVKVIAHLMDQDKDIIWAPDRHLGRYIEKVTGASMISWQGACVVHEEFKARALGDLIARYPDAGILVHPESPEAVIEAADVVGSTTALIQAARELPHRTFIVATDNRIFYKMKKAAPDKTFIEAPTAGEGATCKSCAHCPWMAMNGLHNLEAVLESGDNEIFVDEEIRRKAHRSTRRMLEFIAH